MFGNLSFVLYSPAEIPVPLLLLHPLPRGHFPPRVAHAELGHAFLATAIEAESSVRWDPPEGILRTSS